MNEVTPPDQPVRPAEPMSPIEIEAELNRLRQEISRFVLVVAWAERQAAEAKTAYDRAFAFAAIAAEGNSTEKKWAAETHPDVVTARDKWDVAEQTAKLQKGHAAALDKGLSAVQAINRSVIAHFTSETGRDR